jgi:hypothetical protein
LFYSLFTTTKEEKHLQIVLDRTGFHPTKAVELFGKDGGPIETQNTIEVDSLSFPLRLFLLFESSGKRLTPDQEKTILEMLGPIDQFFPA